MNLKWSLRDKINYWNKYKFKTIVVDKNKKSFNDLIKKKDNEEEKASKLDDDKK